VRKTASVHLIKVCRKDGVKTIGQFHDEIITLVKEGKETQEKISMEDSIERLNDELQLNVPLGTDVQFGNSYADIH
jgi:DNA polymerase I-like protein with 3'-5' exonuclease and polymerase domains